MGEWTPGPWRVTSDERFAMDADDTLLVDVAHSFSPEADIRLIAAAPEMAALLETARHHKLLGHEENRQLWADVDALLSRIRGADNTREGGDPLA